MVVAASIADSSLGIAITGSLNTAVRLIHPVGESFVNQSEGAFLRGYIDGGPRCHECRQRDGQAGQEAETKRIKREAEERSAVLVGLKLAEDPGEIAELIRRAGSELPAEDCRNAWTRLVRSGALGTHDYEIVKVRFSHRRPWGNSAIEESRLVAWRSPDPSESDKDWCLIDAEGFVWIEDKGAPGSSARTVLPNQFGHNTYKNVAVPRGSEVRARRRGHPWTIEAGRPVNRGGDLATAMLAVVARP